MSLSRLIHDELEKSIDHEKSYSVATSHSVDSSLDREVFSDDESIKNLMRKIKKKFRYGPRDSLNKRNRIGKEGSRRFNYWSNEFFAQTLVRSSNDSEGENDVWDDEYDDKYEPSHGFFSDIFHDDDKCKLWEPFLEVTEEQQNQLLSELSDPSEEDSEEENYYAGLEYMSRYTRQTLKKNSKSNTIKHIDKELFELQYISDDEKVFSFDDSYRRLLVHSVSDYYNLISYSKDTKQGDRITVVRKRENLPLCETPLLSILT